MIALRRALVLVGALLLAALAIGSGLDRMSGLGEVRPEDVPAPFKVEALRIEAIKLNDGGNARAAIAVAHKAAAAEPADASPLAIFGAASAEAGDDLTAARAFGITRNMGWREPLTDLFWIREGLSHGDIAVAASHLDALLRKTPALAHVTELTGAFEASGAGRDALAALLARHPPWSNDYFFDANYSVANVALDRGQVATLLAKRYGVHDCALVAPTVEAQLAFHFGPIARDLYHLHCAGPHEPANLADGRFLRADPSRATTALDWHFTREGAVSIVIEPRGGVTGRAVVVGNLASVQLAFATQRLVLAPGRHRLYWRTLGPGGAPSAAIDAAISCSTDEHPWSEKHLVDEGAGRFTAEIDVPSDCPQQWLTFGIAPGASNIALGEVAVD